MIKCHKWNVGVCSWSLKDDLRVLADLKDELNISHVHLNFGPVFDGQGESFVEKIFDQGWSVTSGMIGFAQEDYSTLESIRVTGGIVPDEYWELNRRRTLDAINLAAQLKVKYLSMHFGFLDCSERKYAGKFCDRAKLLADAAGQNDVNVLMETGQETSQELQHFFELLNHPAIGINFDPANMILYGTGEPLVAVKTLAPWIKHVHIKDAIKTKLPGTWGQEVPWGKGQAGGENFLRALDEIGFTGALAIEREQGDSRFEDIKSAAEKLSAFSL